jgi:putative hydrolase of the HAD superfamily
VIDAIVFDFGRVITAQKPDSLFIAYEQDLGLEPGSINRIMFDSPVWHKALLGQISLEHYWKETGTRLNLSTEHAVDRFRQSYYAAEKINPGVLEILHRLRGHFRLAVLSNHPAGLHEWLEEWQLARLFDPVIVSADVGLVKPDRQIFSLLLERLRLPASRVVFIDDTEEHVAAAESMGITALHFTSTARLTHDLVALDCLQPHGSSR